MGVGGFLVEDLRINGFFSGGFRGGGYLKAEGEGVLGAGGLWVGVRGEVLPEAATRKPTVSAPQAHG